MIKISNIKLPVGHEQHALLLAISKKLQIPKEQIINFQILKRSIDARKKQQILFVYQVVVTCKQEKQVMDRILRRCKGKSQDIEPYEELIMESMKTGVVPINSRPVVVGTGPAGLMAALLLAEHGFRPIVFERGYDVDQRAKDIDEFWNTGKLSVNSNVQFGEGGAGTFSDGKLTTRIRDTRIDHVYQYLVTAGAPEEILYLNKPHIGTDKLREVVKNLRNRLVELGGEVFFGHQVVDLSIDNGQVSGLVVQYCGEQEEKHTKQVDSQHIVFAIGHSARDTYDMLYKRKVAMDPKALAIGVRIEHPQKLINKSQYGEYDVHKDLGAAEYQLVNKKNEQCDRTVYSFCMCPGGVVVAAASEEGGVVTNGMSYHARDLANANAALVVNVDPSDYGYLPGESPLLGIEYLRKWEHCAFTLGGSNYFAPVQRVKDFLQDQPTKTISDSPVQPSYRPGVTPANLRDCLPEFVIEALKHAIVEFGKKLHGFDLDDAILTGVETRTSSPIRIHRTELGESINTKGLYPCGEGSGYAGGIISAAVDGLRVAETIIQNYAPPKK